MKFSPTQGIWTLVQCSHEESMHNVIINNKFESTRNIWNHFLPCWSLKPLPSLPHLIKPYSIMRYSFVSWPWGRKVALFQENDTPVMYTRILFLVTVVLCHISSNEQLYHPNPTFCNCFYNKRSHFLFNFDITPVNIFLNLR